MADFSLENSDFIYAYLSCLLPKKILLPILSTIKHHVDHHGVEFTTKWLKSCKVQYLHYLNGSNVHLISTHSDMTPKGSLRPLWSMKSSTVLQVLSISSVTILKQITPAQGRKFFSSVESDPYQGTYVIPVPCDLLKIESIPDKDPLSWLSSPNKAAPCFRGNVVKTQPETEQSYHECFSVMTKLPYSIMFKKYRDTCRDVLGFPDMIEYDNFVNSDQSWKAMSGPELAHAHRKTMVAGKIGFIQEKGAKLRAVANPFRLFQMLLTPLGDFAFACLKTRSWDCTHDQNRGIDFGIQSLQEKKIVHSIDLSDATNLFPLSIQVRLMTDVIEMLNTRTPQAVPRKVSTERQNVDIDKKKLIDLLAIFVSISRGDWVVSKKLSISWTRGQPLGLYPSFPMFAFAHGCIIESIETFLNLSNTFRILGDDVIINHPEVARLYKERMENLGCIISPEKTIVSSTIFEFAGKVANEKGIIPFHKFQPYTFKNPLGPLVLGIKGKKFIDSKVRDKVVKFASIPEPVGLGLNPNNLSLEIRMKNSYQYFFQKKRSTVPYYSSKKLRDHDYVNQFWKQIRIDHNNVAFIDKNYKEYYPVSLQESNDFDKDFISRSNWIDHVNTVNSDEDISLVIRVDGQVVPQRGKLIRYGNFIEVSTSHLWKRILNYLF